MKSIKFDLNGRTLDLEILEKMFNVMKEHKGVIEIVNYSKEGSMWRFIGGLTKELFGINIPLPPEEMNIIDMKIGALVKTEEGFKKIKEVRQLQDYKNRYLVKVQEPTKEDLQNLEY